MDTKLAVNNLAVSFRTADGNLAAVRGVNFDLYRGETLAIVGESGSGKSVTTKAILGILPKNADVKSGEILYEGNDLLTYSEKDFHGIRGDKISMVFQDPMSSLNPIMRVGKQLTEAMLLKNKAARKHGAPRLTKAEAKQRAIELMREVGIADPEKRFDQYPFEFSGGMRQRIVIAIALAADPDVLICDEPTTALDVTIQAQILELINRLKAERSLSIIFITHDLGVVANMADRVAVMYAGKIVEYGEVDEIFYAAAHPYTWALLKSMPHLDTNGRLQAIPGTPPDLHHPPKGDAFAPRNPFALQIDFEEEPPFFKLSDTHYAATWLLHPDAPKATPIVDAAEEHNHRKAAGETLLTVDHLCQYFKNKGEIIKAVDDVSFTIQRGEVFGLVGESGCGKTTTGRSIIGLYDITSGDITFNGETISGKAHRNPQKLAKHIQMIYQDPVASLDPRMTVYETIAEGLIIQGERDKAVIDKKVYEMLNLIGLQAAHAGRYPHEFSGGQRQRIGIARAVIMQPELLIADEPVSALDVSVQAQVINLLNDLREKFALTVLFIAHDLSVVKYFSDRIAVMYFGKMVELASSEELFRHPLHPYTKALLSAIPLPDPATERPRKRIVYRPHETEEAGMESAFREITSGHFVRCNDAEERVMLASLSQDA